MNLYSFKNYRSLLKAVVEEKKLSDPTWSFHKLAQVAGVQRSYMSKVLNGSADLNSDQLFFIADHLQWSPTECEFAQLLLEYARSAIPKRREILSKKIEASQGKALSAVESKEKNLEDTLAYYADPLTSVIHRALLIPRYASDRNLLASDLSVDPSLVKSAINLLLRLKIVQWQDKKISVLAHEVPMIPNSDLQRLVWQNCQSLPNEKSIRLGERLHALIPSDQATMATLAAAFEKAISRAKESNVSATKAELYEIDIRLFSWTKS